MSESPAPRVPPTSPEPEAAHDASHGAHPLTRLRRRLLSGAGYELLGSGAGLLIRFGSNLLLTRLLFPEAFGLSALVVTVIYGLIMLTDVGIAQAVIRSPRGDDPAFLRTAWTLQVMRACGLWVVASLLAIPMSLWLAERQLLWLMPSGSLAVLIHGFCSTRVLTLRRQIRNRELVALELGAQLTGVLCMIGLAYAGWGVWSLVVGNLASAAFHTILSFWLPGTQRDGFGVEPAARQEIVLFGRWILASSALTFGVMRGDQLALVRLLGTDSLGYYNLAFALSEALDGVAQRLIQSVMYPLFAHLHNQAPETLRRAYYQARLTFDLPVQLGLGGVCALAPWIIDLLYDDRYREAGPMLRVLTVRVALGLMLTPVEVSLAAQGLSQYAFRRTLAMALGMLVGVPLGYHWGGALGLLWGTAWARLCVFAVLWPAAHERGLLRISRELVPALAFVLGGALGALLLPLLPRL